jgi:hypothetical protein
MARNKNRSNTQDAHYTEQTQKKKKEEEEGKKKKKKKRKKTACVCHAPKNIGK